MPRAFSVASSAFALLLGVTGLTLAQSTTPIQPPSGPFGSGGTQYPVSPAAPIGLIPPPPTEPHGVVGGECDPDSWHWECGASVYVLRPYFDGNAAYISISSTANQAVTPDFSWPISAAPAVWFGLTAPGGVGFRVRYFRFDQDSDMDRPSDSTSTLYAPIDTSYYFGNGKGFTAPGLLASSGLGQDQIAVSSRLEIDTLDAEAAYTFHPGDWTLLTSFGMRYLHMRQDFAISLSNQTTSSGSPVSESQQENYGHNFVGLGPTVALDAKWAFGCKGLSLYGNVRGSLLVGTQHENLAWAQQVNDPGNVVGGSFVANAAVPFSHSQFFPVGEAEIGLEYQARCGNLDSVFRAGLVSMDYGYAGSASADDTNLNLFGAQFSAAFRY